MLLGVVQKWDSKFQTVDIVTVEQKPFHIENVPVWTPFTGKSTLSIPMDLGTCGLVIFLKNDIQDFLVNGKVQLRISDAWTDEYRNAIFIPGFNSFAQNFEIPKDGFYIRRGECELTLYPELIEMNTSDVSLRLSKSGKFAVQNNTTELIEELIGLVEDMFDYISESSIHTYVNTSGVTTPCAPNVPVQEPLLLALNLKLNKIKSFQE